MPDNITDILFEKNSPEDLILRGFTREYIFDKTGFDAGYKNSNARGKFESINRDTYKSAYIRNSFSDDQLINILSEYLYDIPLLTLVLGLYGDKISFPKLFKTIGLHYAYKDSVKKLQSKRTEETNIEKYGVKRPLQSSIIKQNMKKTCLDRYGTEHPMQNSDVKEKTISTVREKYGVDNVAQVKEFSDKTKETMIERYGVEHPMQNSDIQKKAIKTNQKRYGVNHPLQNIAIQKKAQATSFLHYSVNNPSQSDEVQSKIKQTNINRYGFERPTQSETVKEKTKQTCLEKYSVEHVFQNDEFRDKSKQTFIENYGVDNPAKSDKIKYKMKQTCLEKYGVEYSLQSNCVKEKSKQTCIEKYGTEHPMQNNDIKEKSKQTCFERYGVEHVFQSDEIRDKSKKTLIAKHGSDNPMKSEEVKQKGYATKRERGTFNSSKPELAIKDMLIDKFGEDDVMTQFSTDERYPFNCDFYIKSLDLFIELNASWTHGYHWFNPNDKNDIELSTKWISLSKEQAYYKKAIYVWQQADTNKREYARKNNLNYVVFWDTTLDDAQLWFTMDCPVGHDYALEYSWIPYHHIQCDIDFPKKEKLISSQSFMKAVKAANGNVFYEKEIDLWNVNDSYKFGRLQGFLYANRYKYINKLPSELTNFEILRGMSISKIIDGYTSFDAKPMLEVLQKYNIKSVYDPCTGWGERLLACGVNGISYFGCDINEKLQDGYDSLINNYGLQNVVYAIHNSSKFNASDIHHKAVFTCPPYGNREMYTKRGAENLSKDGFIKWWGDVCKNSISNDTEFFMYQIDKKHRDNMNKCIQSIGFEFVEEIRIGANMVRHENRANGLTMKKNYESIQVFKKA